MTSSRTHLTYASRECIPRMHPVDDASRTCTGIVHMVAVAVGSSHHRKQPSGCQHRKQPSGCHHRKQPSGCHHGCQHRKLPSVCACAACGVCGSAQGSWPSNSCSNLLMLEIVVEDGYTQGNAIGSRALGVEQPAGCPHPHIVFVAELEVGRVLTHTQ